MLRRGGRTDDNRFSEIAAFLIRVCHSMNLWGPLYRYPKRFQSRHTLLLLFAVTDWCLLEEAFSQIACPGYCHLWPFLVLFLFKEISLLPPSSLRVGPMSMLLHWVPRRHHCTLWHCTVQRSTQQMWCLRWHRSQKPSFRLVPTPTCRTARAGKVGTDGLLLVLAPECYFRVACNWQTGTSCSLVGIIQSDFDWSRKYWFVRQMWSAIKARGIWESHFHPG